jgi:hypothetical protein
MPSARRRGIATVSADRIRVEVVYALPEAQTLWVCKLAPTSCVRDAIEQSGVLQAHPALVIDTASVGIFGRLCSLGDPVHDGDRVEIYRPLRADPKEARRRRVELARKRG